MMTPMQRGAFYYNINGTWQGFMKSAIKLNNGQYEYVQNSYGFTLKDVVDAIKWVCQYESFVCIDLFNENIVDKKYLNMSQTSGEINTSDWIYQDVLSDNLHPTAKGYKLIGSRVIEAARKCVYDFVAKQ